MPIRIVGVWLLLAGLAVAAPPRRKAASKPPEILVVADQAVAAVEAALKKTSSRVEQARAEKDIIKLNCVNDKLLQLKGNARLASQIREQLKRSLARREAIDEQHERARLTIIRQKCALLAAEAEACVGDEIAPRVDQRTMVTVEVDPSVKLTPGGLGGEECPLPPSNIKPSQARPGSKPGEALLRIVHRNQMGRCFRLEKLAASLDGKTLTSTRAGQLQRMAGAELELYAGPVRPGTHVLMVLADYRGQGEGRLAHLNHVKFSVRGGHTFDAAAGKTTVVDVVSYEKGKPKTPVADRPALRYDLQVLPAR